MLEHKLEHKAQKLLVPIVLVISQMPDVITRNIQAVSMDPLAFLAVEIWGAAAVVSGILGHSIWEVVQERRDVGRIRRILNCKLADGSQFTRDEFNAITGPLPVYAYRSQMRDLVNAARSRIVNSP